MIEIKLIVSQNFDTSSFSEHSGCYTREVSVVNISENNIKCKNFRAAKMENKTLIDGKQHHMERHLNLSQHDTLLLKESREDDQFKGGIAESFGQLIKSFVESHFILQATQSLKIIGNVLLLNDV